MRVSIQDLLISSSPFLCPLDQLYPVFSGYLPVPFRGRSMATWLGFPWTQLLASDTSFQRVA